MTTLSRMASTRKRSDGRATMERVVDFARTELAEHGPVGFNLDRVIATSGVSRGSIYHHFGSRAGVITTVETTDLMATYAVALDDTRRIVQEAESGSELMDWVAVSLRVGGSDLGRRARARRIATLTAAEDIPALRDFLRDKQREGVEIYVDILRLAVERGLIAPATSLDGVAHFMQSIMVGRVLVDLVDDADQDEAWVVSTLAAVAALLNPVG